MKWKGLGSSYTFTGAELDLDEVIAIYEIRANTADGRRVEVDIEPNGKIEELEVQIRREEVPAVVLEALSRHSPDMQPAQDEVLFEKSLRPSRSGLLEVWYEFAGKDFDVDIRSDAQQILIEPA